MLERAGANRRHPVSRIAALCAAYVAVSAITRLVALTNDIINVDESSYMVGAWELLKGHVPYTGFADNKPPLIYVYYALTQLIGHGMWSVRLVTMLVTVPFTALAVSAFYRHDRRGVAGALAFLVGSASYDAGEMLAVNCELVMLLPLAWAVVLVRGTDERPPGRMLATGALLGIASLVKYQAALWAPPIMIAVAATDWRTSRATALRACSLIAAGLAFPIAMTAITFFITGEIEGFFYWNVTHNVGYVLNPTTTGEGLRRGAGQLLPFLAVTAVFWIAVVRSFSMDQNRYWKFLVGGLLAASLAAVSVGLRFFPHYFVQLYVPLAIGAAPWLASLFTAPLTTNAWAVIAYSLAGLAAFTTSNTLRFVTSRPALNMTSSHVADRLRQDSCYHDGTMFVWGSAPIFYYHAELPLASRFFFPEFPLVPLYAGNRRSTERHARPMVRDRRGRHWRWLMNDLRTNQPTFILDTAPAHLKMWEYFPLQDYPQLERFVWRTYDPLDVVDGVQIYRRRGCDPSVVAQVTR